MKIKLSHLILAFFFGVMTTGCSKSEPPLVPDTPAVVTPVSPTPPAPTPPTTPPVIPPINPPVIPPVTPPTIPPVSQVKLLPVKIESTHQTIIIKYKENTALITSIEDSKAGKKHFIGYNADNTLFGYELYENNERTYFINYWDDSNLRINYVTQFKDSGKITPLGRYTLEYNTLSQITAINYYSAQKELLHTKTLSYDAAANVNSILTTKVIQERTTFTFDQQNGIFKHVDNALLISLEITDKFFNSIQHNVLTITGVSGTPTYIYAYEYNADAYPDQVTLQESNVNTIFKITYKPL